MLVASTLDVPHSGFLSPGSSSGAFFVFGDPPSTQSAALISWSRRAQPLRCGKSRPVVLLPLICGWCRPKRKAPAC